MTPDQREAAERLADGPKTSGVQWGQDVVTLLRELLADSVGVCKCGDRAAAACPGEWEPGCDLGANAKYARAVDHGPAVEALKAEPQGEPVALIKDGILAWHTTYTRLRERYQTGAHLLYAHPPQQRKPPREQITAAAKALCRQASTACNVDFDDNWKVYGDDYIADATAALNAAYGIGEPT